MAQARFTTSVHARFLAGELEGNGTVANVSDGGLFIETATLPELGDTVEVTLSDVEGELWLSGMVWWTTGDPPAARHARTGFGLRLLEESDGWARWIDQLAE